MRLSILTATAGLVIGCVTLQAQYSYYYTDTLTSINASDWTQNGTLSAGSGGLTSSSSDGGSLISTVSVPDGTSDYDVYTTLNLPQSGGTYVIYLRGSPNAMSGPAATGTTYAIELQNPTFSGGGCSATLAGYRIVNGSVTSIAGTTVPCSNPMTVRAVYLSSGIIGVFVNTSCMSTPETRPWLAGSQGSECAVPHPEIPSPRFSSEESIAARPPCRQPTNSESALLRIKSRFKGPAPRSLTVRVSPSTSGGGMATPEGP